MITVLKVKESFFLDFFTLEDDTGMLSRNVGISYFPAYANVSEEWKVNNIAAAA